jgi:DNA repair photolyase
MAIIEIEAKTILATVREPDNTFGIHYNMNLYRGCQHQCIYCDSRSQCYGIENFNNDILVKRNALILLDRELAHKRIKGVVGTGSMNDPYMPIEKHYNLTGQALRLIAKHRFGVLVITKSDLVLRDVDILREISRVHASVAFSISTTDDSLSRMIEPGAPPVSRRFEVIQALTEQGITAGVCMMPILPFLEDTVENITALVERSAASGARFIVPWFGMSLRDRQRAYYYEQLDRLFPGLREKYERAYGDRYGCTARGSNHLAEVFNERCAHYQIETRVPPYQAPEVPKQFSLF